MNQITQKQLDDLFALARHSPKDGLVLLRELQSKYPEDQNLLNNSGAILIDVGSDLSDEDLIREGIVICKEASAKFGWNEPILLYNIANGYYSLYEFSKKLNGDEFRFNPDCSPLFEAKRFYRKAIQSSGQLHLEVRAQLWVNYGNCLSGLGRSAEALSSYDKALSVLPTHLMAKGNLAIELNYFSSITRHNIFKLDSLHLLKEVCSTELSGRYVSIGTQSSFKKVYNRILDEVIKLGLEEETNNKENVTQANQGTRNVYEQFCLRNQLFLNLCHSCFKCKHSLEDNVTFSFQTSIDDDKTFIRLSRVINSIKEQYANSRYLFFNALYSDADFIKIDKLTSYIDNLDYAVYGIQMTSLKLVYQSVFNIFDKIAHFINDYLDLGLKGSKINFTTQEGKVWTKNGKLRSRIMQKNNYPLFALYDIARDLAIDYKEPNQDGYQGYLRRTRNALTHEYLILHVEEINWSIEADDKALHMSVDKFVDQVMELIKVTRSAIIYLIAFIDINERRKHEEDQGIVASMFLPEYDASLFSSNIYYKKY